MTAKSDDIARRAYLAVEKYASERGINMTAACRVLGIKRSAVSWWNRGRAPSAESLGRLRKAGIDLDNILNDLPPDFDEDEWCPIDEDLPVPSEDVDGISVECMILTANGCQYRGFINDDDREGCITCYRSRDLKIIHGVAWKSL